MLTKHRKYRGRQPYNNYRPSRLGAGPSAETAELARARRRRSWPEIGDGGTGPGARRRQSSSRARRRRSCEGLGIGEAGSGLGDGGAGPVPETAELAIDRRRRSWRVPGEAKLFRGSEMAELVRNRRRWSWKSSKTAELARGSGMAELATGPARRRRISSGVRRRWISSAARRRRSWPELGDGEAGRGSGRRNWPGLGDGGAGKGSETVELARGSETVSRSELRDGETGQISCFCLFIGVFRCSWFMDRKQRSWKGLGNGGLARGPETAELFQGSETAELAQSSDLGDGGALLGLGAMAKLAGARRWRN